MVTGRNVCSSLEILINGLVYCYCFFLSFLGDLIPNTYRHAYFFKDSHLPAINLLKIYAPNTMPAWWYKCKNEICLWRLRSTKNTWKKVRRTLLIAFALDFYYISRMSCVCLYVLLVINVSCRI